MTEQTAGTVSDSHKPKIVVSGLAIKPPSFIESCLLVVRRNLIHIKRMPELLMDVTVQPVMFVLLFAFVFGSSIKIPGANYKEFLIPGIMAQTAVFSSFIVALGLVNDLEKGFVDRLKSLPISRASILVGRSLSSLIHSSIGICVMALTGLTVGWRVRDGLLHGLGAFALLLMFGFAMIWIGIWMGSILRTPEAVQGFGFTVMFPLTFLANTFAPTRDMPTWLRTVCEWNPVSALTQALRELWGNNHGVPLPPGSAWPLHHAELVTGAWAVAITAVMAPIALRAFAKRSRD
jgi:ABC transporter DrrB family efflux protein